MSADADSPEPREAPPPGSELTNPATATRDEFQRFVSNLSMALTATGEPINEIQDWLRDVSAAYGYPNARIEVFPTFSVVSVDSATDTTLEPLSVSADGLNLEQANEIHKVLRAALRGDIAPSDGHQRIREALQMPPRFGVATRIAGLAVLSVGISLLLSPTPNDLVIAASFALLVGVMQATLGSWHSTRYLMPVLAAYIVSALTFLVARTGFITPNLRTMAPPLIMLLPGQPLTMSVVELAAGQTVAGASRLVAAVLRFSLIAFGIVAAAQAFAPQAHPELTSAPDDALGSWAPWLGVAVFTVGVFVQSSAPRGSFPWISLVVWIAWLAQFGVDALVGPYAAGTVATMLVIPVTRAIQRLPFGFPALVTFPPAFFLLLPGALGLIGFAEVLSSNTEDGGQLILKTGAGITAIAIGVLCGHSLNGPATKLADLLVSGVADLRHRFSS